jgi:predicted nuclease of predicted toxin-antitoxin system
VNFLADENIHADIVLWFRGRGDDVLYAAEVLQGRSDDDLLTIARNEKRILVTDDKDFGELVFHQHLATSGIVLIRLHSPSIAKRLARLAEIWSAIEPRAAGRFMVISDQKVRIRNLFSTL